MRREHITACAEAQSMRIRKFLATALLLGLVLFTPLISWGSISIWTNTNISLLQLLFVVLLIPEVKVAFREVIEKSLVFRVVCICALLSIGGISIFNHDMLDQSRLWIYCVQVLFFVSVVAWLKDHPFVKRRAVSLFKLVSVIAVLCVYIVSIVISDGEYITWRDINVVFYNNIRHFNYDLAYGSIAALMLWVFHKKSWAIEFGFILVYFIFGFIVFFTGGRGQLISLLLLFVFGFTLINDRMVREVIVKSVLAFSAGCALSVFMYPHSLNWLFQRSTTADLNRISSGRLVIWHDSIQMWLGDAVNFPRLVFGLGPDSFRLTMPYTHIVHPHNSLVQALMEFGLLGLVLIIIIFFKAGHCVLVFRRIPEAALPCLVACALCSLLVYSLVDGILYHGSPMLMMVLMGAFMYSCFQKVITRS